MITLFYDSISWINAVIFSYRIILPPCKLFSCFDHRRRWIVGSEPIDLVKGLVVCFVSWWQCRSGM